jgi:hypothetical protein
MGLDNKSIIVLIVVIVAIFALWYLVNGTHYGPEYFDMISDDEAKSCTLNGEWSDSCRNPRLDRDGLTAECRDDDGTYQATTIDPFSCPDCNLINNNGVLKCAADGRCSTPLPWGKWKNECTNPVLHGNVLSADCPKTDGSVVTSHVDYTKCAGCDVINDNGTLKCNVPSSDKVCAMSFPGNWATTCTDGMIMGDKLVAQCKRNNGIAASTSIDYGACKSCQIDNIDGKLTCH